jgi:hypothetical protein
MDLQNKTLDAIYKQMRSDMTLDEMWAMIEATITRFKLGRIDAAMVRGEFD